jgi:hypothetical protein
MNREAWLHALAGALSADFVNVGHVVPKLAISVGFPSNGGTSALRQRIGECWNGDASDDGTFQIFISPVIADGVRAGDVLVHEMCHSVLPKGTKHNRRFAALARDLGLDGKPTATVASPRLVTRLNGLITDIGPYPHSKLSLSPRLAKQTTRLLKVSCEGCGYTVRITRQWLDKGAPICPTCGVEMEEAQ